MIKFTPEELKIWEEVFKPKLYDKKGFNKKQAMKFLLNTYKATLEVIKVYHHVTNGAVLNFATPADEVIAVITDLDNQNLAAILKDEKEKWTSEQGNVSVEKVDDTCYVRTLNKLNQFHTSFEVIAPSKKEPKKYQVVWDSQNQQMLMKSNKPIPEDWQPVAREAIIWLTNSPERKELLITK